MTKKQNIILIIFSLIETILQASWLLRIGEYQLINLNSILLIILAISIDFVVSPAKTLAFENKKTIFFNPLKFFLMSLILLIIPALIFKTGILFYVLLAVIPFRSTAIYFTIMLIRRILLKKND